MGNKKRMIKLVAVFVAMAMLVPAVAAVGES